MSIESTQNELLLLLALDRLIKRNFLNKLKEIENDTDKWKKNKTITLENINKHNQLLIENITRPYDEAKKQINKAGYTTKLYGRREGVNETSTTYRPKDSESYNIQQFINEGTIKNCPNKKRLSDFFYKKLNNTVNFP